MEEINEIDATPGKSARPASVSTRSIDARDVHRLTRRPAYCDPRQALGIIIGIAAVIAMMIGSGSRRRSSKRCQHGRQHPHLAGGTRRPAASAGSGQRGSVDARRRGRNPKECPEVEAVSPIVRARTQVIFGNKNWVPLYIYGAKPSYLDARDWTNLQEGVPFTDGDVSSGNQVCMIGQTIVRELFGGRSPLGREIRIQNVSFKVIGVLQRKGANMMGMDQDDIVLAPWTR